MADIAFNWAELEKDLSDPSYLRNYIHANKANFSQLKERHPENIWIFRLEDSKYWLLGRLSVDPSISEPKAESLKKHWVKFNPSNSELFIPAIEIPSTSTPALRKISTQMFHNNGQGGGAALTVEKPEVIEIETYIKNVPRVNFLQIDIESYKDELSKTPYRLRSGKKAVNSI